jgi:hypothetical protein
VTPPIPPSIRLDHLSLSGTVEVVGRNGGGDVAAAALFVVRPCVPSRPFGPAVVVASKCIIISFFLRKKRKEKNVPRFETRLGVVSGVVVRGSRVLTRR